MSQSFGEVRRVGGKEVTMPGYDGSGPLGGGPMTGGGFGRCGNRAGSGTVAGLGRGRGLGFGRRMGGGPGFRGAAAMYPGMPRKGGEADLSARLEALEQENARLRARLEEGPG